MTHHRSVRRVLQCASQFDALGEAEVRQQSRALRYRAQSGESLVRLLPEAYALVRVAAGRALGMRHYDVQMRGGVALFHNAIVEMETGEGKTLTATLPLYLRSLVGRGVHIATVNDYLAQRDADWNRPLFELLGMSVGVVQTELTPHQRRAAYACDITYGTAKEFGFDFLRDRLAQRAGAIHKRLQRAPYFVLVDEADSVLIDDARTPLLISAAPGDAAHKLVACYRWSAAHASQFHERTDYEFNPHKKTVELTLQGRQRVRSLPPRPEIRGVPMFELYEHVERAIKVAREFHRDRHYVVQEGEIVIVDEGTGRLAEGRQWSEGIHQAVEAKEGLEVTVEGGHAARITVQDFFLRYQHLAGMTGTARPAAAEFRSVYRRSVVRIPTHRPSQRRHHTERVFATAVAKWKAIVAHVRELHAQSRPVLIGTRTIEASQQLSAQLTAQDVPHQVLNAHHVAEEATIIAGAGQPGRVTVATNMAGRGTDIELAPSVAEQGGLFVITTELHESARIDRQLIGRCARQGDPGAYCQYLSLEDHVLTAAFGKNPIRRSFGEARTLRRAQRLLERRHRRQRRILLHQERERHKALKQMGHDPYLDALH